MGERTESAISPEPADRSKVAVHPIAETPEISTPMLDVHPSHELIQTWRSFFIHIATIVIGLFIAVGLEQTVELFHHRHQRAELERQLHDIIEFDQKIIGQSLDTMASFRAYLVELRAAIITRRGGQKAVARPPADDPRMRLVGGTPSLAPYDAARENGTIALLPAEQIRIYNRVALQRELFGAERDQWLSSINELSAFRERFVETAGLMQFAQVNRAPDLAQLSATDLSEYLGLVATVIKQTDVVMAQLRLFHYMIAAILDGVDTEQELIEKLTRMLTASGDGPGTAAAAK